MLVPTFRRLQVKKKNSIKRWEGIIFRDIIYNKDVNSISRSRVWETEFVQRILKFKRWLKFNSFRRLWNDMKNSVSLIKFQLTKTTISY